MRCTQFHFGRDSCRIYHYSLQKVMIHVVRCHSGCSTEQLLQENTVHGAHHHATAYCWLNRLPKNWRTRFQHIYKYCYKSNLCGANVCVVSVAVQKSSLHITTSPLALLPNSYFRSKCKIVLKPIYPNSVTSLYCGGCSFNDKWAKLAHETWQAHDLHVLSLALRSRAAPSTHTHKLFHSLGHAHGR